MTAPSRRTASVQPGFRMAIDQASARHQLHMSAGVVVVLALAILASAFAFRPQQGVAVSAVHPAWSAVAAAPDGRGTTLQRS